MTERKRSERMQPVQRIAGERAQAAARRYAQSRENLNQETEQLEQLRGFRREYEQKLTASGQNGIDAYRLRDYNAFMSRIDRAIDQQKASVSRLEEEVESLRQDWLQHWGNARALDQLVERYQRDERRAADAREQKRNDELAQRGGRQR